MKSLYRLKILYHYLIKKYELKMLNEKNLQEFQTNKLKKHLKFVKRHSVFYNKCVTAKSPDLADFPIVNKKIMMDNFDEFCTVGIKKEEAFNIAINSEKSRDFSKDYNKYTVALSSGTSGNRGLIVASDYDKSLWTGGILAKCLPDGLMKKEKIAFFLRANSNIYESLNSNRINFKYFDLMANIDDNIDMLHEYKPTIISAPPSMLLIISEYVQQNKITINPKKIISVAEVLNEADKCKLEKIFKMQIDEIYQATEGFLGHTCKYGTLHINEDVVKIEKEYLDKESGRFIPIITDFRRRTQPIIRYRLNDILVEKRDKCKCGSPFMALEKIEGREDDVFHFSSKKGTIIVFPDFISRAVIYGDEEIESYFVFQKAIDKVEIYIDVKNKERLESIKRKIQENFYELQRKFNISTLELSFINEYTLEKGRKMKRVIREF